MNFREITGLFPRALPHCPYYPSTMKPVITPAHSAHRAMPASLFVQTPPHSPPERAKVSTIDKKAVGSSKIPNTAGNIAAVLDELKIQVAR